MGPGHIAPPGTRDKNRQNFIIKTQTSAKVIFTATSNKCQNNTLITNKKPKNDIFTVYLVTDYNIELMENLKFCIVIFNKIISVLCKTKSSSTLIGPDYCFFLIVKTLWSDLSMN